jgi:hypothetical protein
MITNPKRGASKKRSGITRSRSIAYQRHSRKHAQVQTLWGFEYDHGYQEAYRARVRLAELEAIEMDQIAGIKHVMRR